MKYKTSIVAAILATLTVATMSACSSKSEKAEPENPVAGSAPENRSTQVASTDAQPYYLGASSAGVSH